MDIKYRQGTITDLDDLKKLAIKFWGQFQPSLTTENWQKLINSLDLIKPGFNSNY